jgi:hypothetical protein
VKFKLGECEGCEHIIKNVNSITNKKGDAKIEKTVNDLNEKANVEKFVSSAVKTSDESAKKLVGKMKAAAGKARVRKRK